MKKLYPLLLILVLLCTAAHAQKRTFLRFYSMTGNKFNKGYFYGTTDSSILIYKNSDVKEIAATSIGYIKTRRSWGHNILLGALSVGVTGSIIGLATSKGSPDDWFYIAPAEAALDGLIIGGTAGIATGALISAFTKSTTFIINGTAEQWRLQRKTIDLLQAYKK